MLQVSPDSRSPAHGPSLAPPVDGQRLPASSDKYRSRPRRRLVPSARCRPGSVAKDPPVDLLAWLMVNESPPTIQKVPASMTEPLSPPEQSPTVQLRFKTIRKIRSSDHVGRPSHQSSAGAAPTSRPIVQEPSRSFVEAKNSSSRARLAGTDLVDDHAHPSQLPRRAFHSAASHPPRA